MNTARWEYTALESQATDALRVTKWLDEYGEKGWELVSVSETTSAYTSFFVFKRLKDV